MRVLILNYEFPPLGGGAGNATLGLVKALEAIPDMEVVVVTSSVDDYQVDDKTLTDNSTIYRLPVGKNGQNIHYQTNAELLRYIFVCWRFLNKLLKTESFDLCHSFMTVPSGFNSWLLRKKMPYLISLQGSDVPGYSERFSALYTVLTPIIRRIWKDSSGVISNSQALRELALEAAPDQDIGVIPNGIDRQRFSPAERMPSTDPRAHIVCVGRLIERKGVWELLEAMPKVLAAVPTAHLNLLGSGDLEDALNDRIARDNLQDAVTLHGAIPQEDLPIHLRQASVFALPSHAEGMSNALLEGIACGTPIVVTDTGGTSELLDGNGIVVPMRDPNAIADALIAILSDSDTRQAMRDASLALANRYSWEALTQSYYDLYQDLVSTQAPAIPGGRSLPSGK